MGSGVLTRYNASAGSGKTYKLTSIYLTKLFSSKNSYKRILAVTFTNKAAAEMKRKILSQLYSLSKGEDPQLIEMLSKASGRTTGEIVSDAKPMLHTILHDYSSFNVGTIDSFFQKVLKAFTREIGLQHGYIIELDHSLILKHAVDAMFAATAQDAALREWITEYSYERTEGGKSWNLREDILKLAEEIFREKFRLIPADEREKLKNKTFLVSYAKELKNLQADFGSRLNDYSKECRELLEKHNVTDAMFLRGDRGGVPSFLNMAGEDNTGPWKPVTATVRQVLETTPVWTSKAGPSPQLKSALANGFDLLCLEAVRFYNENFYSANTARFIADNIYILGILANVLEQVHVITSSENRFLLSDAGELLWLIIKDDQTPFIYEKTGNRFENFMIDEFQDTSHIQWNNFRPLIENSMAEGNDNLVVGDVKQSIYRWRNSDWRILRSTLNEQIRASGMKDEFLDKNWRSSENIIAFNNTLFSVLPGLIDRSEKNNTGRFILEDLYKDAVQKSAGNKEKGKVRIEFLETEEISFQENALMRLPLIIEELQDSGYSGSDIGILVRTNREGADVLNRMLEYRESVDEGKKRKYNYNIISSESLLLSAAPPVVFIMSALKSLYEDDNRLSISLMIRNWMLMSGMDPFSADYSDVYNEAGRLFPDGFREFFDRIRRMTLFESVESVIRFFRLGDKHGNTAYLNSLQDCVLEFSGNFSTDIPSFLEWWENTGVKKSVVVSDQPDSMRVMTIHKSKGLEFRAVVIPFISWNTGHGSSGPTLWVSPAGDPFRKLGIVPVKYKADLQYSAFSEDYFNETYYTLVDNINLLYVAFTRAVDALYGFCPLKSKSGTISKVLYDAFLTDPDNSSDGVKISLRQNFDSVHNLFSFGEAIRSDNIQHSEEAERFTAPSYYVNNGINRLHLRFHGENWLGKASEGRKNKINYGTLMHEILESVHTPDDVDSAIEKMLIEGRIKPADKSEIESRIKEALGNVEAREWFSPGLKVMNETAILLADGTTKRPDRVIITDEKVIIIDFKFGNEKEGYKKQLEEYRTLIETIENKPSDAFIWYVDNNKITSV